MLNPNNKFCEFCNCSHKTFVIEGKGVICNNCKKVLGTKKVACLKCDKVFYPVGKYNRICNICNGENEDLILYELHV